MNERKIIFQAAQPRDSAAIWRLLHANSRGWDKERIEDNLSRLYLLFAGDKLLGVLCGEGGAGETLIHWIEVHPLFPERAVAEIMIREYREIYWRTVPQTLRRLECNLGTGGP
ncbi:hypothetical protein EDC14_101488 [Hydrogenispora ethanolica]|jgi:hypothetical protein|uniref:N-acetyltransferase domain-containing protein n=1 Tax=Hydrogenispora ethanolica TaxID=1082276 RepID=A0A4R1RMQ9_HYDET|nr:hypothetical protein [Hydrogenispora ethanolica]TCL67399.1 hypothetical protein EDC14_101488 [Hydrogenispora ethanolica]